MRGKSKTLEIFLDATTIERRVKELAADIDRTYAAERPLFVVVLKGGFVFASDLIRAVTVPIEIEFIGVRSYGAGTSSTGAVEITYDLPRAIEGRHVLLVEDIVDTGLTARFLLDHLMLQRPATLRLCSLLYKPTRAVMKVPIDFLGFKVPNRFIVGYGLDLDEQYRDLDYLGFIDIDATK